MHQQKKKANTTNKKLQRMWQSMTQEQTSLREGRVCGISRKRNRIHQERTTATLGDYGASKKKDSEHMTKKARATGADHDTRAKQFWRGQNLWIHQKKKANRSQKERQCIWQIMVQQDITKRTTRIWQIMKRELTTRRKGTI